MTQNPATFRFYTLGCKVNQYESQALTEQLLSRGFRQALGREDCDFIFINTCAVTSESVRKVRQMTRRARSRYPGANILLTGCACQLQDKQIEALEEACYLCGTRNKTSLIEIACLLRDGDEHSFSRCCITEPGGLIEPMHITSFDRTRAYVKIQDGCSGKCAYCIIPTLRGPVCSKPRQEVVREVQGLIATGCREIVLTGIETSAYEYDLATLIEELQDLDGLERIRLGSLDPSFMKPAFVDRIASLDKVAPHFHLSLQSGSNSVLGRMRRRYRLETALSHVAYLRERMPRVQFSTDIIVGFPGETEEEFEETVSACRALRLLHIHVFPYSRRPGTVAADMDGQLSEQIKHDRAGRLIQAGEEIRDDILRHLFEEGRPLSVLAETEKEGIWSGHSAEFVEVCFPARDNISKGDTVLVTPKEIKNGILLCDRAEKVGS